MHAEVCITENASLLSKIHVAYKSLRPVGCNATLPGHRGLHPVMEQGRLLHLCTNKGAYL